MGEHFVIKNIRRSIKEAQSRKGMIVGLPEIRIPASHAEVLLVEIDRLKADLEEAQELVARYDGIKDDLQMDKAELQNQLAEAKTANLAIRSERDQAVAQLHAELAEARAEVVDLKDTMQPTFKESVKIVVAHINNYYGLDG